MNFLFWNINKKPLQDNIKKIADLHQIDFILLAECEIPVGLMLDTLNNESVNYEYSHSQCNRIKVFSKFNRLSSKPKSDGDYLTIREIKISGIPDFLLAIVHLPSKLYAGEYDYSVYCQDLRHEIERIEKIVGHQKTIFVGDFNMNPFEESMIAANGLNAVMHRKIAMRVTRTLSRKDYSFFYNPMWNRLGDMNKSEIAGTYYYNKPSQVNYYWHMFDQVLIRPNLISNFDISSLEILVNDGNTSFLKNGTIDTKISDHLPIKFSLTF